MYYYQWRFLMERSKKIIRTSIIGIFANVLLAAFKAFVGIMANSVAVTLDAVNNLSDAMSSLITIIGTHLAGKHPDRKHPFGHGRVEYLSAAIISLIVLYAGITSFVESAKKIISPETPDYSSTALLIIAAGVIVKILLGTYVKKVGKEVNSDSLTASGQDAFFDSVISASTLAAAVIFLFTGVSLEAWLGALISIVIIKSGIEMLRETLSSLLGQRIDVDVAHSIKRTVNSFPEVLGAYDLVVHDYGPDRLIGSIHISVPDTMSAAELDTLSRRITAKVLEENHVYLSGISVYSTNTTDSNVIALRNAISKVVTGYPGVMQIHGFYLDLHYSNIQFDVVISYDALNKSDVFAEINKSLSEKFPQYTFNIALDYDIAD